MQKSRKSYECGSDVSNFDTPVSEEMKKLVQDNCGDVSGFDTPINHPRHCFWCDLLYFDIQLHEIGEVYTQEEIDADEFCMNLSTYRTIEDEIIGFMDLICLYDDEQ